MSEFEREEGEVKTMKTNIDTVLVSCGDAPQYEPLGEQIGGSSQIGLYDHVKVYVTFPL